MSANSHFFSHDFNARNNYKLLELRSEYGWEGYGIFWAICEVISENDKPLPVDRLGAVSVALGVQREFLASFIKFCLDLNIFIQTEAGITSESLEERLEHKRAIIKKVVHVVDGCWVFLLNPSGLRPPPLGRGGVWQRHLKIAAGVE